MKVALGQFSVAREWQANLRTCIDLMQQAQAGGADLLVLPEAVMAQDSADPTLSVKVARPLDGPFVSALLTASRAFAMTTILGLHVPAPAGKASNVVIALRDGAIVARYHKLHLYDSFAMQESRNIQAGDTVPPLFAVAGMTVGLMTCYDIRFPELAGRPALDGADVLVLPSS